MVPVVARPGTIDAPRVVSDAPAAPGARPDVRARRWPFVVTLILGLGLIAAPAVFRMFDRAPKGGDMINEFRPYMTEQKITGFQGDLEQIDAAVTEARRTLEPRIASDPRTLDTKYGSYVAFRDQWPGINDDMSDMLTTMHGDLDNFAAVDALPPFPLFPWFFVIPGVLVAGASAGALVRRRHNRSTSAFTVTLVVLGVGLVAAPAVFQMFSRAPKGGDMINDFRPLMTTAKVERIQGYFLVIGAGEGTLRNEMLPALDGTADEFPELQAFSEKWPAISNEMAPMIGAMSDNLDNYAAVHALPPFPLFPWFFVTPGVLLVGFAWAGRTPRRSKR